MERTANSLAKLTACARPCDHQEADRVPVSDFFWGSFLERWRDELGLPADANIYKYYDLDWQVTIPNMDPHIKPFEVLQETDEEVVVKTGFDAIIRKKFADPMPEWLTRRDQYHRTDGSLHLRRPVGRAALLQRRRQPARRRGRRLRPQLARLDRHGQIAAPRLRRLRQRLRGQRVHVPHRRPGEHHALDRAVPGARTARFIERTRAVRHGDLQGADQGGRRPAGRHGDLGGHRLHEGHALLRPSTGAPTSSPSCRA